jgi:hypothetical protein
VAERKAFLDSSVLLSRKFGLPKQKKKIERELRNSEKLSTDYARTEIKRTFIKDAIFLHSILVDEQTLTSVYQRLRTFPTTTRQKDRCLSILERVSDKKQLRYSDALTRLENLISVIEKELLKDVQILKSGTGCSLASEEIEFDDPYFRIKTSCTRKNAVCSLPNQIAQNSASLNVLKQGITGNKQFEKLSKALVDVLQNPEKSKGVRCKILGDTLICLDAPDNCDILSTNINDFSPICFHLRKQFVGV